MKSKLSCDIVLDLLPSYVDELTRETTNKEVKEHLEECESCLKSYIAMQTPAKRAVTEEEFKEIDFLKTTKKKQKRKLVLSVAMGIGICLLLVVVNRCFGNPVSHLLAANAIEEYITVEYIGTDYYVDKVGYEAGVSQYPYYATIKSESSRDTVFTVYMSTLGEIEYDNYKDIIGDRYTTYMRITKEYAALVAEVFEKEDFPIEPVVLQGEELYGARIQTTYRADGEYRPDYGIVMKDLELDKEYDMYELGRTAGTIDFHVNSEQITAEKAAEYLLLIKEYFDQEGVTFYAIDFLLSEPMQEGRTADYISVTGFLYEDIYEEGLVERVQAAHDAQKNYWEGTVEE